MPNLIEFIDTQKLSDFEGGIHPPGMKSLSNTTAIERVPLLKTYHVPLTQHLGEQGRAIVKVGDKVLKGQALTQALGHVALPVHAPTSGTVTAIAPRVATHASGLSQTMITIAADGEDKWRPRQSRDAFIGLDNDTLLETIKQAGIAGLGGATFPSHVKLAGNGVDCLIINGVECEPYITSDDRLMREHAQEILIGIEIAAQILNPKRILFAIEDNKPEAVNAVAKAINTSNLSSPLLQLRVIPTKYPSGGEKQLIEVLTGKQVPSKKLPIDINMVVHNVGTLFAIKRAVLNDEPLIERVTTVTGENVAKPGNYWALLGTPVDQLLGHAGFKAQRGVIVGGPMMGFSLPNVSAPITKSCNCIIAPTEQELPPAPAEMDCIRCGECAIACPAGLLPQQLFWYSKAGEHDKAREYNIQDCIECGACAFVCPSAIPLVEYYRKEKAQLKQIDEQAKQAQIAKVKFEARLARLEAEKQAREQRHRKAAADRKQTMSSDHKDAIAAALARAKAKKAPQNEVEPAQEQDPKKAAVAAALARAKAKKAAQAASNAVTDPENDAPQDDKKAAVAAAIARAKAKKLAQKQAEEVTDTPPQDDKKAAVAAAIARAKAKKLAQKQTVDSALNNSDTNTEPKAEPKEAPALTAEEQKQARVAAAVAKAKAKKLAPQQTSEPVAEPEAKTEAELTLTADEQKKARVAAAVAKAKAKKLAQQAEQESSKSKSKSKSKSNTSDNNAEAATELSPEQQKKARVAAAVAKAKAKKLAQQQANNNNIKEDE
ncbi:electron transport complex subunit RsxC [Paraferrimonas sp. SM1919]|uniref:electron transport complex subunit RsxC n=1 Tax=Paraferrimonas sp. SM1919 TaxID=2662263 RepID=UPI0013D790CC|nr:electron transport complex subunit RsxC [Paraferrimonas sp. SM1919]